MHLFSLFLVLLACFLFWICLCKRQVNLQRTKFFFYVHAEQNESGVSDM
ncbi:hypothetical protein GLYMA_03G103101v4 [Glycine max]|nr:hypothetical protein GLYMA_03G103101v4 [Glycine max]